MHVRVCGRLVTQLEQSVLSVIVGCFGVHMKSSRKDSKPGRQLAKYRACT